MRTLIFAFALLPAAALAADRDPPVPAKTCKTAPQWAAQPKPAPLRPQTLDKMPRAEAYYPVLRIVDGCEVPIKVRDYRR